MLTIYKASAGSGKTHQLTLRYVKLLLGVKIENSDPPKYRLNNTPPYARNQHRGILAITFTNKATEEMKSRIVSELVKISQSTDVDKKSAFIDDLTGKIFGCTVEQLAAVAKRALYDLLLDFDNFNVSTIDAFFQQVLRSLAYELDYPGNYEVVIQSDNVTAQAVDMMLDDFNFNPDREQTQSKQLRKLLHDFMREQLDNGESFNVFNRNIKLHSKIVDQVGALFDEKFQLVAKDFNAWFNNGGNLSKFFEALKKEMRKIAVDNKTDIDSITKWLETRYAGKVQKAFYTSLATMASPIEFIQAQNKSKAKVKFIEKVSLGLSGDDVLNGKDLRAIPASSLAEVNELAGNMLQRIYRYHDYKALIDEVSTYSFMRYTNYYIEQFRKDNNIVVLADTNDLLKRVMSDDGEISFVYEKMGVNLHNFLIDEFQDTSRMQWSNLKELVYNSLGEDHDSLIIGDEKQAIYRFRNSDSSMLHNKVKDETLSRHAKLFEEFSDTNWRSTPEVIKFNNSFFSRMSKHLGIDGYKSVVQGVSKKMRNVPGHVHFFNAPAKTKDEEQKSQLELMHQEIKRQLDAGYRPGEIAVLVNTKKDGIKVVQHLMAKGIDVTTSEALMLNNSQSVRLVVSIMQMVVDAKERQINEDIYAEHNSKKRDNIVNRMGHFEYEYTHNLQSGMSADDAISKAIADAFDKSNDDNTLAEVADIAAINPSTIATLVDTIIEKRITPEQRINDKAYLAAFQDVVLSYAATYGNNVVGFLQWWRTMAPKLAIDAPEEAQAITIMTVHKSKGLEFPCVHIPFASWALEGNKTKYESVWIKTKDYPTLSTLPAEIVNNMPAAIRVTLNGNTRLGESIFKPVYDSNMAERIVDGFNKTYVAYTRAERELCVYYDSSEDFGKDICMVNAYDEYNQDIEDKDLVDANLLPHYNADLHLDLNEYVQQSGEIIVGGPTTPQRDNKAKEQQPEPLADWQFTPDDLIRDYPINVEGKGQSVTTVDALVGDDNGKIDDDAKAIAREKMEKAAERGERLHFILSHINRLKDIEKAMYPTFFYKFTDEEKNTIRRMFANEETLSYVHRWFRDQERALSEVNIFDPNAPETESKVHRPDRIVWNKDGSIDIVDYKFTGDTNTEHNTQVRRYINLMQLMYPGATINGYIWYADLSPAEIDLVK